MDRRRLIERLYPFNLHVGLTDPLVSDELLASLGRLADRVEREPAAVAAVELPLGNTSTREGAVAWLRQVGVRGIPGDHLDLLLVAAASTFHTVACARSGHAVAPRNPRAVGALAVFADPQGGGLTVGDAKEFVVAKLQDAGLRLKPQTLAQVPDDFLIALATPWAKETLARKAPARPAPAGGRQRNFSDPTDPYGLRDLAERTHARYQDEERRQGKGPAPAAEPLAYRFADVSATGLDALRKRLIAKYEQDEARRRAVG